MRSLELEKKSPKMQNKSGKCGKICDSMCGFLVMVYASPNPYVCQDASADNRRSFQETMAPAEHAKRGRESHPSTVVQEEGRYSLCFQAALNPSLLPLLHSLNCHCVLCAVQMTLDGALGGSRCNTLHHLFPYHVLCAGVGCWFHH